MALLWAWAAALLLRRTGSLSLGLVSHRAIRHDVRKLERGLPTAPIGRRAGFREPLTVSAKPAVGLLGRPLGGSPLPRSRQNEFVRVDVLGFDACLGVEVFFHELKRGLHFSGIRKTEPVLFV